MGTDHAIYLCVAELVRRHARRSRTGTARPLGRYELRGFSQNGEDGVIAEIMRRIGTSGRTFVEFGIESGREGNCVLLADVLGWSGLFIEPEAEHFRRLSAKYAANRRIQTVQSLVTPDNVERLFRDAVVAQEPDILSIDVDGADYWIWEAITSYLPRLVVVEYNAALGALRRAVQPRDHSGGWDGTDGFGASIAALEALAEVKGYRLVHTDLTGCNAFFVRADLDRGRFPPSEDVARLGQPNYFLSGHEHPHDPAIGEFVDPFPSGVLSPAVPADELQFSLRERVRLTYRHEGAAAVVRRTATLSACSAASLAARAAQRLRH